MRNKKLLVPVILLVLFLLAASILEQKISYLKQKPTPTPSFIQVDNNALKAKYCDETDCLIDRGSHFYGYATLSGYYKQYEATDWGNKNVLCDGLVVIDGNASVIGEFRNTIEQGNRLNKIIDGELVVNINLSSLTQGERNLVMNASATSPAKINFAKRVPRGTGVSTCYSVIDIFSVEKISI